MSESEESRPTKRRRECYKCPECQKQDKNLQTVYSTIRSLKRHIFASHAHEKGFALTCGIEGCVVELHNRRSLSTHIMKFHTGCEWTPLNRPEKSSGAEPPRNDKTIPHTPFRRDLIDHSVGQDDIPIRLDTGTSSSEETRKTCCTEVNSDKSNKRQEDSSENDRVAEDQDDDEDVSAYKDIIQISNERRQLDMVLSLTRLKAEHNLSQVALVAVQQFTEGILENVTTAIVGGVKAVLNSEGSSGSQAMGDVFQFAEGLANPFQGLNSEWITKKILKEELGYVEPETVVLHESLDGGVGGKAKVHSMQYVPILNVLRLLYKDKQFREAIRGRRPNVEEMVDFQDGSYYRQHPLFAKNLNALQLQMYYDGFEVVNPLGSKIQKHNIGALYFSILNLDPVYRSTLKNICLTAFVYENDIKHPDIGWKAILRRFNADLKKLEEGLQFHVDGEEVFVQGTIAQWALDNKAAHSLFGLQESFYGETTCISRYCHCTSTDIQMRDLVRRKIFTVHLLNSRIANFNYNQHDAKNRPSLITEAKLREDSRSLKQYAAQYWCLLRKLPLIIGDRVPAGDEHWQLLLQLVDVVDLIMSPKINERTIAYLDMQLVILFKEFQRLFPETRITPKMHYTLHYPRLMRQVGPLIRHWVMRFEAKHHFFKRAAVLTGNYINVPKTLAERHQMVQVAHVNQGGLVRKAVSVDNGHSVSLMSLQHGAEISALLEEDKGTLCDKVTVHGTVYQTGYAVLVDFDNEGRVEIGKINSIIVSSCLAVCFTVEMYVVEELDEHFHSWKIEMPKEAEVRNCLLNSLPDHQPVGIHVSFGQNSCLFANFRHHVSSLKD